MKEYIFDISKIHSLDDWWDMYIDIVKGPEHHLFGRNLDAYSDSLCGGPGCPELPCKFIFINIDKVAKETIYQITIDELKKKMQRCHYSWKPIIDLQLKLSEKGIGETIHHWILDPIMGQEQIELVIKNRL